MNTRHEENLSVFLSYSKHDRDFINWLQTHLREAGIQVWDEHALIRQGAPTVRHVITESDACLLVIGPETLGEAPHRIRWQLNRGAQYHKLILPIAYRSDHIEPDELDFSNLPSELNADKAIHVYPFEPGSDLEPHELIARILNAVEAAHGEGGTTSVDAAYSFYPPDDPAPPTAGSPTSFPASRSASPETEVIRFKGFFPTELYPERWYSLLGYAHVPSAEDAVQEDSAKRLGNEINQYQKGKDTATDLIARGATLTVVPYLPGVQFNPPQTSFLWLEDWHRVEFRMRAVPEHHGLERGTAVNGSLSFYVGPILVGEVKLWTHLAENDKAALPDPFQEQVTTDPYQRIFVSYSHKDAYIVDQLEKTYQVLGIDFLRDIRVLRAGETWNPALLKKIEEADVFQLCWSETASTSPHVEQEWRYAQQLNREAFIRPCYWEKPMPPVPTELSKLHFACLNLPCQ